VAAAVPDLLPRTGVRALVLGRTAYPATLERQRRLHAARVRSEIEDVLLLTEHERVLTLGRKADDRFLRFSRGELAARGIAVIETERGGDVTYHGPGQLVAYPILDLRSFGRDVLGHVRRLEETAIRLLALYGIDGERRAGLPGVWAGERKIASVGVYVSRWVTMHGLAINLAPALSDFDLIHPCGLVGVRMTSVVELGGQAPDLPAAFADYARVFDQVFAAGLSRGHPLTREGATAPDSSSRRRPAPAGAATPRRQ
jgi:lipoate-protein ligase B